LYNQPGQISFSILESRVFPKTALFSPKKSQKEKKLQIVKKRKKDREKEREIILPKNKMLMSVSFSL